MKTPARLNASSLRKGPRSMVIKGHPPVVLRHAWSSGLPSTRDVMTRSAIQSATVAAILARCVSINGLAQWRSSTTTMMGVSALAQRSKSATTVRLPSLRAALSMASYVARSSSDCARSSRSFRNTCCSGDSKPRVITVSAVAWRASWPPPGATPIRLRTTDRIASWPLLTPKSSTNPLWTTKPLSAAIPINSSTSRVLPIPASPRTTIAWPLPLAWHASTTPTNCASSARRPTKVTRANVSSAPRSDFTRHTRTGASMPFTAMSPSESQSTPSATTRRKASEISVSPGSALS